MPIDVRGDRSFHLQDIEDPDDDLDDDDDDDDDDEDADEDDDDDQEEEETWQVSGSIPPAKDRARLDFGR
ncbi:MAG TPA: hypothetical protein VKH42_10470 [Vicinamibacterales bacterium]|nr:hypothetical protein [Vicinamibacterales bacterium]